MALSMVPFGGAIDIMLQDTRLRLAHRVRQTVEEIVDETGENLLASRLTETPEVEAVFIQGIEAATRTGHEAKRRLLGRVITASVLDDAKVDESLLFVMALRDLDAPHLRALEAMRRAAEKVDEIAAHSPHLLREGKDFGQRVRHSVSFQVEADTAQVPSAVVAPLARTGVLESLGTWKSANPTRPEHYKVSEFGERLLEYLREVED